ncbi:hypothetical protein NEOLI_001420 [Neolecta irregularis DAH-3]|uniref:Uncharacterized protein n=1 Tax=Neolecta irregularis (strain DAH-3) TaxID=1198029 RepID=A0A1U7LGJ8_NEOID|nr:hypothetical protein NEOLI_001420 [Neolecta irregularis DAH-3]|eukprot:OLL21651.1 hypothetical protein NEOLI_001420 [Neolecta irregularis DAH-3]
MFRSLILILLTFGFVAMASPVGEIEEKQDNPKKRSPSPGRDELSVKRKKFEEKGLPRTSRYWDLSALGGCETEDNSTGIASQYETINRQVVERNVG